MPMVIALTPPKRKGPKMKKKEMMKDVLLDDDEFENEDDEEMDDIDMEDPLMEDEEEEEEGLFDDEIADIDYDTFASDMIDAFESGDKKGLAMVLKEFAGFIKGG